MLTISLIESSAGKKKTSVRVACLALIPALMSSFLISRKSYLYFVVFKRKARKPKPSASCPKNHCRHTHFPGSTWHYICITVCKPFVTVLTLPTPNSKQ